MAKFHHFFLVPGRPSKFGMEANGHYTLLRGGAGNVYIWTNGNALGFWSSMLDGDKLIWMVRSLVSLEESIWIFIGTMNKICSWLDFSLVLLPPPHLDSNILMQSQTNRTKKVEGVNAIKVNICSQSEWREHAQERFVKSFGFFPGHKKT